MTRPGPLTCQKRPSWNTTPRSYSRRMRSELASDQDRQQQERRNADRDCNHRDAPCEVAACGLGLDLEREAVDAW